MKVLLINTSGGRGREHWLPLGLASITAVLRKGGHSVELLDYNSFTQKGGKVVATRNTRFQEAFKDLVCEKAEEERPDFIGMNTTSPEIYRVSDLAKKIRKKYSGILAAGGYHATALPAQTLEKIPELDYVFTGEGEYQLLDFANGKVPEDIPGVISRNGRLTRPVQLKNLDELPFPSYDIFDKAFYAKPDSLSIRGFYLRTASILTSRGCPYSCTFCCESLTYGKGVRFHSPGYVAELLKKLVAEGDFNGFYFQDNDFLADPNRAMEICRLIKKEKLEKKMKWAIETRADRLSNEYARELKSAGCVKAEIGIESFSQSELDSFNKRSDPEKNLNAIKICNEAGIRVHGYFLSRTENETVQVMEEKLKMIKKSGLDTFSWNNLMINPGTLLYLEKGGNYFEKNEWTEEIIKEFFTKDWLSGVSPKKRAEWVKKRLSPRQRRMYRRSLLKNNSFSAILHLASNKLKERK